MALFSNRQEYSEDLFADTRMSFGEHLEDLRTHLLRAIYGFLIALVFGFLVGWPALQFISSPVERELARFYDDRAERVQQDLAAGDPSLVEYDKPTEREMEFRTEDLAKALGIKLPPQTAGNEWVKVAVRSHPVQDAIAMHKGIQIVGRRPGLSTLSPQEAFMAYMKVSFVCGLVLGSPWIFMQIWAFIAAGLYPHEKRLVNVYLPISVALFIAGVLLCEFVVISKALQALLFFNRWLNLEPDLRFNEWLSFAILLPVLFGISFQLPLLMMFLDRVGIFTASKFIEKWRIAFFAIHVFAAFITPVDIISMESLALTMCALYGLGILLCRFNPPRKPADSDVPEPEEMVEV